MIRDSTQFLSLCLEAAGSNSLWLGELIIRRHSDGYELFHRDDGNREELIVYTRPEDARLLSTLDDQGAYRPLKSAPNLRHGWRLIVPDLDGLRKALDFFYPAAIGLLRDWEGGALQPVNFRDTLDRQSGMYAVTKKITHDQAQAMIGQFCSSGGGCLKTILWQISAETPVRSLPDEKFNPFPRGDDCLGTIPLLCHEACNLLVARAREVVKAAQTAQ